MMNFKKDLVGVEIEAQWRNASQMYEHKSVAHVILIHHSESATNFALSKSAKSLCSVFSI